MINIREETMSGAMTKYHVEGLPSAWVFHRFTHADPVDGDFHCHPWKFRSIILHGGYTEEILNPRTGEITQASHFVGDSFEVPATHIHRIVHMPADGCWTLIQPGPWERVSRLWQFRHDGAYSRAWNEEEWTREV